MIRPVCIVWLFLGHWLSRSVALSCVCNPAECETLSDEDCPGRAGTVWDPCGCCRVCARAENQPCGGPYGFFGSCAHDLECVVTDLDGNAGGVCTRVMNKSVSCVHYHIESGCNIIDHSCKCEQVSLCTDDGSLLSDETEPVDGTPFSFVNRLECEMNLKVLLTHEMQDDSPDDGNCTGRLDCEGPSLACPSDSSLQAGTCSCDPSLCKAPPTCYDHQQLHLVKTATKVPGDCCDMYDCLNKPGTNCSEVVCPKEDAQCPADSYQLPTSWHPGDCCGTSLGCQCLPSSCAHPSCSQQEIARVVRVGDNAPGTCCPIYECVSKDVNEACENGTSWLSADCEECKCERGIKFCSKVECPQLPTSCTRTGQGRCCPVCLEESAPSDLEPTSGAGLVEISSCLLENGTLVHVGDTYFADPCTNCTCQPGGRKHCTASMCEVPCVNPQYVPGECCPVCDGSAPLLVPYPHCTPLVNCKLRCKRGFVTTPDGCIDCQCQDEECILDCQYGYLKDTNGNDLCECAPPPDPLETTPPHCPPLVDCTKKCPHGLKRKQGCEVCRCAQCPSMNQCEKQCTSGYARDENGCHMCKCRPSGDNANSACYTEGGVWRDDSEVWRDGCHECHCIEGREMCTLIACPNLPCSHPTPANSTQCCPYCPDGPTTAHEAAVCMDFHGQLKLEAQHWTLNSCTDCTCRQGKVLCYSQQCPPVACPHPVAAGEGGCCPRCVEDEGVTALVISDENGEEDCGDRRNGTAWREGPCVSCRCERGHRICYQQECVAPSTPCVRAVTPKHACCSTCLDALLPKSSEVSESQGCRSGNVTYLHSQEWRLDDCTRCVCRGGNQQCTQQVCSVSCSKPVSIAGQCCPLCLESPPPPDSSPSPRSQIQESLYILLVILFCISLLFSLYACRQMRARRRRLRLQDYGCAPPQYQYKYIPTYTEPRPPGPPPSEEKEKLALAPV